MAQAQLIVLRFRKVTLFLDGDDAGRNGAEEIAARLVKKVYVRIVQVQGGTQPDSLTTEDITSLLK